MGVAILLFAQRKKKLTPRIYVSAFFAGLIIAVLGAVSSNALFDIPIADVLLLKNTFGPGRAVPGGYGIALGALLLLGRSQLNRIDKGSK